MATLQEEKEKYINRIVLEANSMSDAAAKEYLFDKIRTWIGITMELIEWTRIAEAERDGNRD